MSGNAVTVCDQKFSRKMMKGLHLLRFLLFAGTATVATLAAPSFQIESSGRATVGMPQTAQSPVVVFVISGILNEPTSNMDAVATIENGKIKLPFAEENEAAQARFAKEYFAPGKKYRVTFGGGEVGTATVTESGTGCNNIHARATVEDKGRIPPGLSGLATNLASLARKPSARRAPSADERAAVIKLVNKIYRTRRTTPAQLRTLRTTNLTATDLNGDGAFELIGSFVIETKNKVRKDLLLIAEPGDSGFNAGLVHFQSYQLPPEGFDSSVDFVDQLDVDGDGTAEVFTIQRGFDAYGYNIYKKINRRWRVVLRTIGDAC